MSLSAAALKLLADKGLSAHDIAEIALANEPQRSSGAERQARYRARRKNGDVTRYVTPSPKEYIQTPTREKTKPSGLDKNLDLVEIEKREAVSTCLHAAFPVDLPPWMPESWAEFRAMRKRMRSVPFESGAERRCIAKLTKLRAEGHDPEKLISKAIENGHRTFFPDETTKADSLKPTQGEQVANLKKMVEFYSREGKFDEVRECRRRLAQLEGGPDPPANINELVRQTASGMRG